MNINTMICKPAAIFDVMAAKENNEIWKEKEAKKEIANNVIPVLNFLREELVERKSAKKLLENNAWRHTNDCYIIYFRKKYINSEFKENNIASVIYPDEIFTESYQTNYNVREMSGFWQLCTDLYAKNGKLNNELTLNALRNGMKRYDLDIISCEVRDVSDEEREGKENYYQEKEYLVLSFRRKEYKEENINTFGNGNFFISHRTPGKAGGLEM